jgi:hypothetical protein
MDPLSPAITFFDKEGKGRTSYIGSLIPENLFYPTPGLWFTNQDPKTMQRLIDEYERSPYPSSQEIMRLTKELNAPDPQKIESFFRNMQVHNQQNSQ